MVSRRHHCFLLGLVGEQLDWQGVVNRVRHGDFEYLLLAIVCVIPTLVIGAYRWHRLLVATGIRLDTPELGRVDGVSTFSGTFLPATIGADVTRVLLVDRRGSMLGRVTATVLVDRAAGLIGMLGLAWISVARESRGVPREAVVFLAWVTAAIMAGAARIALATIRDSQIACDLVPRPIERLAVGSRDQLRMYLHQPRLLVTLALLSLTFQVVIAAQVVALARAIRVHLDFATAAVAVTLLTVVSFIPISIGGFGVLGAASLSAVNATPISLLTVVTRFTASLPGAYLFAQRGLQPAMPNGLDQ